MPYPPTSPTTVLCDALVTYLKDQWKPQAPDEVKRAHRGQLVAEDMAAMAGRQVRIAPIGYTSVAATRGRDFYTHRIGVLVAEKYEFKADPEEVIPIEWIDERCDWVHTNMYKLFDFARNGVQPSLNKDIQTISASVEEIYDEDWLQVKVFWCWIEFEIQELEAI